VHADCFVFCKTGCNGQHACVGSCRSPRSASSAALTEGAVFGRRARSLTTQCTMTQTQSQRDAKSSSRSKKRNRREKEKMKIQKTGGLALETPRRATGPHPTPPPDRMGAAGHRRRQRRESGESAGQRYTRSRRAARSQGGPCTTCRGAAHAQPRCRVGPPHTATSTSRP
jgi:hypothetical protein